VPWVLRSCLCNAHNALCNRHAVPQPVWVELPVVASVVVALKRWASSLVLAGPERSAVVDEWLDQWSRNKRNMILRSVRCDHDRPGAVKFMVKRELLSKVIGDLPTKARGIQAYPNLRTQESFAREFKRLQNALLKTTFYPIAPGLTVTFASGLTPDDIGGWLTEAVASTQRPTFYECDGKNWDSTMSEQHMRFKEPFYRRVPGLYEFARACFTVRGTVGRGDGRFRYKIVGTTKSGHNDTTLGNSIVNASIKVCAMLTAGLRGHIIVAGDDALIVVEGDEWCAEDLASVERKLGIVPVAAKLTDYRAVSFISLCFLRTCDGFVAAPKPGRLFARLGWTVKNVAAKKRGDYLHSLACGLAPYYRGSVVMRQYFTMFSRLYPRRGYDVSVYMDNYYARMPVRSRSVTDSELASRYHIPAESWLGLGELFARCSGPGLLMNSTFERLLGVDLADVSDRVPR
jgi:hypothetical protein